MCAASSPSPDGPQLAQGEEGHRHTALLQRVAGGDEGAFAELYDLTAPRVHGLVRRLLRNDAHAEEVTQEVFLEVWRTAPRFQESRGRALSWMLTIAHRRAVDRIRSVQAQSVRDVGYESRHEVPDPDPTGEAATDAVQAHDVRDALDELSPLQQEVLALVYWQGMTHREAAEHLGVPLGTTKTRIRDGLGRLAAALRRTEEHDG